VTALGISISIQFDPAAELWYLYKVFLDFRA